MRVAALAAVAAALAFAPSVGAAQDKYFDAGGVRLRYVEQGAGEPVVLVHGFTNTADIWSANGITQDLARNYRVIAFDMRGHGKSDKPHDAARYGREMGLDIVRLLDHLGIQRAHIVGYSMGGHVVSQLLTLRPERFLSATLVAGSGRFGWDAVQAREAEQDASEMEHECISRSLMARLAPPGVALPPDDSLKVISAGCRRSQDPLALAAVTRSRADHAMTPAAAAAVTVPTLAIVGTDDPMKAGLDALVRLRPSVRLVVVEGATHAGARGVLGRPELIAALRGFLSAHAASPSRNRL
jgi:pimeloyl-ACP methyl ester carboxylesterase